MRTWHGRNCISCYKVKNEWQQSMYHGGGLPRTLKACIRRQEGAALLQHSNQLNWQDWNVAKERAWEPPPETPFLLEGLSDQVFLRQQPALNWITQIMKINKVMGMKISLNSNHKKYRSPWNTYLTRGQFPFVHGPKTTFSNTGICPKIFSCGCKLTKSECLSLVIAINSISFWSRLSYKLH